MEATRVLAVDALETALEFYFEDNRKIPAPSSLKPKMEWVYLGPTMTAKVLLHNEMLEQGIDAEELRRRMSTSLKKIRHILDPRHMTKIEQMDAAFRALGKSIQLQLVSRD